MSAYHYLFIRPRPRADDELVRDISDACSEPLAPVDGSGTVDYATTVGHAAVELELTHEYEEDFGIPFETFASLVVIRDFDRDQERQERLAREIFAGLSNLNKYALVLVFDLQTEIGSGVGARRRGQVASASAGHTAPAQTGTVSGN